MTVHALTLAAAASGSVVTINTTPVLDIDNIQVGLRDAAGALRAPCRQPEPSGHSGARWACGRHGWKAAGLGRAAGAALH